MNDLVINVLEYMGEGYRWNTFWAALIALSGSTIAVEARWGLLAIVSGYGLIAVGLVVHIEEDVIIAPMFYACMAGVTIGMYQGRKRADNA